MFQVKFYVRWLYVCLGVTISLISINELTNYVHIVSKGNYVENDCMVEWSQPMRKRSVLV